MKRRRMVGILAGCLAVVSLVGLRVFLHDRPGHRAGTTVRADSPHIVYPADGAVFPPELPPPTVSWNDALVRRWTVQVSFGDGAAPVLATTSEARWRPAEVEWEGIKRRSVEKPASLTVAAIGGSASAPVHFRTDGAPVGAPLFFREVILPFAEAVRDPSRIRWRFGPVSAREPPTAVLENLPVCGNCHSFSKNGSVMGMDVDYANDKGSYGIAPVAAEVALTRERIITWSDFRRDDGELTFGLLSQVSPRC